MLKAKKSKLIVILGPTSSGKSEVAVRLAKKLGGEIISADSRQIYRGMDIGTGKVESGQSDEIPQNFTNSKIYAGSQKYTSFHSEGIPHYLINVVNPTANYNVSNFKKDAEKIIADILKRGKLPIICGGTGFWIKAIVDNVNFPEVRPNNKLRKELEKYLAEKLFKMLEKLDPRRAKNIDRLNKIRLIRAIEICKVIGKVPVLELGSSTSLDLEVELPSFLQIGLFIPKEKLYENIKKRLKKRFEAGMIEEISRLKKTGLSWKKIQSFGLGYYWIPLYLHPVKSRKTGLASPVFNRVKNKQELFEKVYLAEKNYAKRQMTWFKRDKRIKWLKNYKEIEKEVKKFIEK